MKLLRRFLSIKKFTLKSKLVKSKLSGFTLIELLVVIAILGILVTIGINLWQRAVVNARDQVRRQDLNQLKTALELYFEDEGSYPPETLKIGGNPNIAADGGDAISCFGNSGFRGLSWGRPFSCNGIVYIKNTPIDPTAGTQGLYCYNAVIINQSADPEILGSDFFEIWAIMENPNNGNTTDTAECLGEGLGGVHYNYVIRSDP